MAERLPQPSAPGAAADSGLRRIREWVSAGIAALIIIGTIMMMVMAFNHLSTPEEFARLKDLLLFINPLLGVVIGYYFNKATSEARAESAEATAQSAMTSVQEASEARNQAQAEAKEAKSQAEEAKSTLKEMSEAAEKVMAQMPPPAVGVLGADEEGGELADESRMALQMALKRAQRLLG